MMAHHALLLLALVAQPSDDLPRDGQRVVFLGDSITAAGGFVRDLEAYLVTRFPDRHVQLINLGLSSETVTGLTETDHPFPRPDVHERLARALEQTRPDHVVAGYGMNDGIYHPFDDVRFRAYRRAITRLSAAVRGSGARLTLITPGPFEASAIPDKVRPAGAADYSYRAPFADYDATLARYGQWLLGLRDDGIEVIDARSFIVAHAEAMRKADPAFRLTGDAIHPHPAGQWLIASAFLDAWHAPAEVDTLSVDLEGKPAAKATKGEVADLSVVPERTSAKLTWTTPIPAPLDPGLTPEFVAAMSIDERINHHGLIVRGLAPGRYALIADEATVGQFTAEQFRAGLDLLKLPDFPTNRRAAEVRTLLDGRERLLTPAWVTRIGHKRPDTPAGRPLAEAQTEADTLEARARSLARPAPLRLKIERLPE